MLEVFNTLLRQLRLSVDYELTGSYDGSTSIGTKIIKAHEERQLQEAVIRTIGESSGGVGSWKTFCGIFWKWMFACSLYVTQLACCCC